MVYLGSNTHSYHSCCLCLCPCTMSSAVRQIVQNTGWLYAKMGITMFISLLVTRLILQSLGASDFGIYNVVGGSISMLGFISGSLASASTRFMAYAEGQGDQQRKVVIFNVCVTLHYAIATLMMLVFTLASFIFFGGVLNIPPERMTAAYVVYGSMVVGLFFSITRVPYDAVINAHERMKFYAIVGVMESVLKLLVALACVYTSKDKLIIYGILMAVIPIAVNIVTRVYCKQHFSECLFQPRAYWDKSAMKEMLTFAFWVFCASISSVVSFYGSGIVLNHFFGTILNAAYGIATQLNGQLMAFSNNMHKAVIPVITKSEGSGQREVMIYRSTVASKYSYLILAVLAIPFMLEMDFILKVWLKEIPQWTVMFAQLVLIQSLIGLLTSTYVVSLEAEGNISLFNRVRSVFSIVPIILLIIVFMQGAPPIMLCVIRIIWNGILGACIILYFMKRNCGMNYGTFFRLALQPVMAVTLLSLLSGGVPVVLMEPSLLRLTLTVTMSLLGFGVSFWFLAIQENERIMIKGLLQQVRKRIKL